MDKLNLVLKFKFAADHELHVKGARRMKLDGHGGLVFEDAETGTLEKIDLRALEAFRIQAIANPLPLAG